jgi:hypothetical protein
MERNRPFSGHIFRPPGFVIHPALQRSTEREFRKFPPRASNLPFGAALRFLIQPAWEPDYKYS